MRKADQTKGIFCLEGLWDTDLKKGSTVRPLLELLRVNVNIPYIHRECATVSEFEFYAQKWPQKRYAGYPILYLTSHGEEFGINLEDGFVNLDRIGELIGKRGKNRVIVISSCSTLETDKRNIRRVLRATECMAICGYKVDVDWMRSAAFEILLFYEMQSNEFSGRGIDSIQRKGRSLSQSFPDLGFRIVCS